MTVAEGSNVGGDFKHIPAAQRRSRCGCVIAFSTFNAPVPANAMFGRPAAVAAARPADDRDVLCTNPAALGGGSAPLDSVFPIGAVRARDDDRPRDRLVGVPSAPA